ncbi:hypothetical protein E5288_WYG013354 [Bos mutus]|uniref:Uncharacterized protein n=1 Tax=Bos mutus TaxID=72004 RepID=A0A6B0S0L5_9CETA|nr:hypothetical protein [Bos mutus]
MYVHLADLAWKDKMLVFHAHRHQSDHECEKLEIPKPRMAATQKLVKDIIGKYLESMFTGETTSKRRKGAKNSETAAKMSPDKTRCLPHVYNLYFKFLSLQTERIYFQVFLPKGSKEKRKAMFFCRGWSVGKATDFAASLASLKNDNNRLTAKPSSIWPKLEKTEVLFITKTEETVVVRSSYRDKQPNSSYLRVQLEDDKMLQVVNVTKTLSDVTNFTIHLVTGGDGETNLTVQLWDSEGRRERLIEEIKNVRVRVLRQRQDSPFQASNLINRNILMLFLPMILLNKCAFGCKIEFQVFETVWKRPLPVVLGAVIQFFLMPFCGFLLTQILALPEAQAFGFIVTCTCPGSHGWKSASRKRPYLSFEGNDIWYLRPDTVSTMIGISDRSPG